MKLNLSLYPVPSGTSERFDCPKCGGRKTLSITNEGSRVLYNCYRASCNLRGVNSRDMSLEDMAKLYYQDKPKEFKLLDHTQYGLVNKAQEDYLRKHYCLEAYEQGLYDIAYDAAKDRLLFLVMDSEGKLVGAVGRDLTGKSKLKALNYHDSINYPFIVGLSDTLVIVEDCASACSVARKYTGCALLGTHLKDEYLESILKYDRLIVALDKDATDKAIKMEKTLRFYKDDVTMWFLDKDLKDMEVIPDEHQ